MAAKLIYKGNHDNLPTTREANAFYLCEDTRELYFGANLYTEAVRFYTGSKPASPAQGVLYIHETTGAGDVWNGTAWVNVFKAYATTIDEKADHTTVPTTKATKDYVDQKVADVVAGEVGTLGDLASKDKVSENELDTALKGKIDGKAEQSGLDATDAKLAKLIGDDDGKSARTISAEEATKAVNDFATKVSDDGVVNSFKELVDWAASHGSEASEMVAGITAIQDVLAGIGGDGEQPTVAAYVADAVAALKIGDYAKAADLSALAARVSTAEGKLDTLTGNDTVEGSVAKALKDAKKYTDDKDAAMDTRVEAVENTAHDHANADELAKIEAGDKAKWDAVVDAVTVGTF